jgi:hypothetical protein
MDCPAAMEKLLIVRVRLQPGIAIVTITLIPVKTLQLCLVECLFINGHAVMIQIRHCTINDVGFYTSRIER